MRQSTRNREGMALVTALLAIVLIGALIAGTFFATTQEYRTARNALGANQALSAADYGPNLILRDWNQSWNALPTGNTQRTIYTLASGAVDTVVLTKLRFNMFLASSTGHMGTQRDAESRRRVGVLIRLNVPTMPIPGAFSGNKSTTIAGNYKASGNDSIPAGWTDCPPAGPQMPAVATAAAANVTTSGGCGSGACLTGTPKILPTTDASDSTKIFDGWDDLTSRANIIMASATLITGGVQYAPAYNANGTCNTASSYNWGDPTRSSPAGQCETYFPIIWITSVVKGALGTTAVLNGNSKGQGILLVDGNLNLTGGFEWVGPIIVRGNVSSSGNGNKTVGGIVAYNQGCITSPCNSLSGTSNMTYSSCTINKILSQKASPILAKQHAWTDLY